MYFDELSVPLRIPFRTVVIIYIGVLMLNLALPQHCNLSNDKGITYLYKY